MMIAVNRSSSTWPVILKRRHFCVNILHADQEEVALRFAGVDGVKGTARYEGADWTIMGSGASGLDGALAVIDCEVEEIIERHSHGIVLGAVRDGHQGRVLSHPDRACQPSQVKKVRPLAVARDRTTVRPRRDSNPRPPP